MTAWSGSHRCRGSGTASVRVSSSRRACHECPQLGPREPKRTEALSCRPRAPFAGSEGLPNNFSFPACSLPEKFLKAAGGGAGSARCGNSPTPPRGAPQDEEEPRIPFPLLPSSDFAGEQEVKKVLWGLARRRGAGPWGAEQGNASGKLPGGEGTRGKFDDRTGSIQRMLVCQNQTTLHKHLDFEGIWGDSSEAHLTFLPFSSRSGDSPDFPQNSTRAGQHGRPQESLGPWELWAAQGTHSSMLLLANSEGITLMFFKLKVS